MFKSKKTPYGYIYRATNIQNGKNYIGKTKKNRWENNKNPIEERWKEEIDIAYKKNRRGEELRHIENAIIKYGPEIFDLREEDKAYSREELNAKEQLKIKEYDSANREKGYNMTEGGDGCIPTPEVVEKMTKANQEIARNPETLEKMSESLSEKWKDQDYQESVSRGVTEKWQELDYREKQYNSRFEGKREIQDKEQFLKDIREMKKKDLNQKHDMDGKCMNRRIKEMLGHHGVNNFSQAKKYLEGKNLQEVLKDINENMKNKPQEFKGKKEISNKREFLEDIQNMKRKDIEEKYNMNRSTVYKRIREMLDEHGVKNYIEAKNYLEGKNLDKVAKDISERLSDKSQQYEGKTEISNKRKFLEDIQNLQKNEIDIKYGMDAKTVNRRIGEILGDHGVKNYTEAKEYLQDKNLGDVVKDIEGRSGENQTKNDLSDNNVEDSAKKSSGEHENISIDEATSEEKNEAPTEDKNDKTNEEEKENISEDLATESENEPFINKYKDSSEEVDKEQELETSLPPSKRSDQEIIEENIKSHEEFLDKMKDLEKRGFVDYINDNTIVIKDTSMENWEQWEPDENVGEKDYDGIDNSSDDNISDINLDYDGIEKSFENESDDFRGLDEDLEESGKDFEGIDDHTDERCEDYDGIDDEYGGSEYGGEA
ncbi:MAG: hypothetical protein ACFFDF_11470 [Candidatus Odinarchaeota archaeon]